MFKYVSATRLRNGGVVPLTCLAMHWLDWSCLVEFWTILLCRVTILTDLHMSGQSSHSADSRFTPVWHDSHIVLCFTSEFFLLFMNNEWVWVLCCGLLVMLVEGLPACFMLYDATHKRLSYITDMIQSKKLVRDWIVQMVVDQCNDKSLAYSTVVKIDNINRLKLDKFLYHCHICCVH